MLLLHDRDQRERSMAHLERNMRREMRRVVLIFASLPILTILATTEAISSSWWLLLAVLSSLAGLWLL
jgi:fatty acid desaturase